MVMKDFIQNFPHQIKEAVEIGSKISVTTNFSQINNIIIAGQGGSGIGGMIVKNLLIDKLSIPVYLNQDYTLPAFADEKSIFIASSYSGNTEETLSSLKKAQKRNCNIFCICSGGELLKIAEENDYDHVVIPSGGAPRAMLCYSVIQLLFFIYKISSFSINELKNDLLSTMNYILDSQESIILKAKSTVSKMGNKMPFIYTFPEFEGAALRFKQQLNENSKQHALYNLIPEMNHNEIVGWSNRHLCSVPVFFDGNTSNRNKKRLLINIDQINKCVDNYIYITSDHSSSMHQYFFFIHLGDWISLFLAEKNNLDPDEIDSIHFLKNELKK
tara:strand:+ start:9316 stop:10302 length:987 start_codon:yes stop_codon:yes gene_type:complete